MSGLAESHAALNARKGAVGMGLMEPGDGPEDLSDETLRALTVGLDLDPDDARLFLRGMIAVLAEGPDVLVLGSPAEPLLVLPVSTLVAGLREALLTGALHVARQREADGG